MKKSLQLSEQKYSNEAMDRHIEVTHLQALEFVKTTVQDLRLAGRPTQWEGMETIVAPFQQIYNGLLTKNYQETQAITGMHIGKSEIDKVKRQNSQLGKKISELRMKNLRIAKREGSDTLTIIPILKLLFSILAVACLIGFEAMYIANSLSTNTSTLGDAFLMSIGIVVSIGLVSHATIWIYERIESLFWRRVLIIGVISLILVVFYTLAELRVQAMKQEGIEVTLSPWHFTAFNILVFFALAYVSNNGLIPAWREIVTHAKQAWDEYTLKKRETEIEKLDQNIEDNDDAASETGFYRLSVLDTAKSNEDSIETKYHECYAALKNEILNGMDHYPLAFDAPPPPLRFYYRDIDIYNFTSAEKRKGRAGTLILIPFLCSLQFLGSCIESRPGHTSSVYLILDTSNRIQSVQDIRLENIKPFLGLESPTDGSQFTLATISDLRYNQRYCISLESTNAFSQNKFVRQKHISRYFHSIDSTIHHIQEQNIKGTHASYVFFAISKGLEALSQSHASRKSLIVLSDLAENDTEAFSVYESQMLALLQAKPDSMVSVLQLDCLPKSLGGITCYFIHAPQNQVDDMRFEVVSGFLKLLLEKRKARVIIISNL